MVEDSAKKWLSDRLIEIPQVSASSVYVDLWLRLVMAVSPSLKVFFLTLCSAVVLCMPTVDPLEELKRRSAAGPVDWTDGRTGYVAETRTGSSSPCGPNFECIEKFQCDKDNKDDFNDLLPKLGIQKNLSLTECIVGLGVKGVCCKVNLPSQECGENEICEIDKCPVQREQEISDLRETRKACVFKDSPEFPAVCCDKKTDLFDPVPQFCGVRNPIGVVPKGELPLDDIVKKALPLTNTSFASFGEYPWQAMLFVKNADTGAYDFEGGGVLISTRHVLTAAHEVDGVSVDAIQVRLGEWMMDDASEPMEHQDYYVDDVHIHSFYRSRGFFNDLAVLTLKKDVFITNNVHVVCLPQKGESFVGQRCVTTGWGAKTFDGEKIVEDEKLSSRPEFDNADYLVRGEYSPYHEFSRPIGPKSNTLKEIELPVISWDECQRSLREVLRRPTFPLHPNFICAGGEGEDACEGDGGGPLVCEKEVGEWVLAGITSWGVRGKCGVVGVPGAYAAVEPALDWIHEVMKLKTPFTTTSQFTTPGIVISSLDISGMNSPFILILEIHDVIMNRMDGVPVLYILDLSEQASVRDVLESQARATPTRAVSTWSWTLIPVYEENVIDITDEKCIQHFWVKLQLKH
ncbi:unnamed protein product [Cyprideis torosa]|uniref:Uncharacterized protein n=1 Tax=Cyprideis torosa TaxID=163714 RepID=A0A7R8W972_9CRUS|nr:unnamed protein product [Cyprideis torosa]CAG0884567.1 unnamed protein product [Cyprideis torosa]